MFDNLLDVREARNTQKSREGFAIRDQVGCYQPPRRPNPEDQAAGECRTAARLTNDGGRGTPLERDPVDLVFARLR